VVTIPGKATHQQTRAHNAALVLRALYDHGPVSRADVARMTGLTRTTVGEIVSQLLDDGMAREIGFGPSTGGKQPILVEVIGDARHVIGLDLGEFVFRAALVDLQGTIRRTAERPVTGLDGDQALAVVHELIDELADGRRETLLGIGVGTPGIVDVATGTIRAAVNLDWEELPLGRILTERHGVPVRVSNDSRAAALAVEMFVMPPAAQRTTQNLVAIKVGRGIGAGVILGGEVFHGDSFGAGEIGHTVVEDDGAECRCGRRGCLETVASSRAIVREATASGASHPDSVLGRARDERGELTLDNVREALEAGDAAARGVVVAAARSLGRAIAGVVGVLDVERIVLHGSVATMGDPWIDVVREEAARRSFRALSSDIRIDVIAPGDDLVVRGASALLLAGELGLAAGARRHGSAVKATAA
jgi:predicted NBD/HSP70 family sugar kinase